MRLDGNRPSGLSLAAFVRILNAADAAYDALHKNYNDALNSNYGDALSDSD